MDNAMPPGLAAHCVYAVAILLYRASGGDAVTASATSSPTPGACTLPADFTCSALGGYVARVSQRSTGALNVTTTPAVLTASGVYWGANSWNLTVFTQSGSSSWRGSIAAACASVTFSNGQVWVLVASPTATWTRTQTRTQALTTSQSPTQTVSTGLTRTLSPTQTASRSYSASQTGTQSLSPSQLATPSSSASQSVSGSPSTTASESCSPSETTSNSATQSVSPSESGSQRRTPTQTPTPARTPSKTQSASVSPSAPPPPAPAYDPKTTTTAAALIGVAVLVSAAAAVTLCLCTSATKMDTAAQRAASEMAAEQREHADADDEAHARRLSMVQPSFGPDGASFITPSGSSSGASGARRPSAVGGGPGQVMHGGVRVTPVNMDLAPASSTDFATVSLAGAAVGLSVGGGPVRGQRAGGGGAGQRPWGGGGVVGDTEDGSAWGGSLDAYPPPPPQQQHGWEGGHGGARAGRGGAPPVLRDKSGGTAVRTLRTDADIDDFVGMR